LNLKPFLIEWLFSIVCSVNYSDSRWKSYLCCGMYHVEVNNDRVFTARWNLKSLRRAVSPKHYVNQRWHL